MIFKQLNASTKFAATKNLRFLPEMIAETKFICTFASEFVLNVLKMNSLNDITASRHYCGVCVEKTRQKDFAVSEFFLTHSLPSLPTAKVADFRQKSKRNARNGIYSLAESAKLTVPTGLKICLNDRFRRNCVPRRIFLFTNFIKMYSNEKC
jgi:hypothetical protein